ncbi:hypothetical protein FLONG3_6154 [Fusarium longipes]|uniref:Uncharacterized protein n=1 Tax=Fusarium longipes TaxID=694270 RepID=A0A395SQC6_9HYPO|nr:hypothetical protein FLONG3_6154 [Fusarium longipes]
MSMLPSNIYPPSAGIENQVIENIILDSIARAEQRRKLALLAVLTAYQDRMADEESSSEEDSDGEREREQLEGRRKVAKEAIEAFRARRDNPQREQEEEDDEDDEDEEEEEYDDDEEETEESEESEESEDEASDDGSEWDSLFLLVHNMPAENDEPKSSTRKRSLPRDDSPYPPPRPESSKRQRLLDPSASKLPQVQVAGNDKPRPITRKRGLVSQEDTPATEVPFPKRQKVDASATATNGDEGDDTEMKEQEAKSSVPSEWLAPHQEELQNSQLPGPLRSMLGRLPVSELHREAQAFLLSLDYVNGIWYDLAKAAIDMGLRFSKTAKSSEYAIVFQDMTKHPLHAVAYMACKEDKFRHVLFWEKVQEVIGKEMPPERIKERRERRAKREAEAMARFNARKAAEEAKRESQQLKEKHVSQIGEASKLPLREKVGRWLADIVQAEKKGGFGMA